MRVLAAGLLVTAACSSGAPPALASGDAGPVFLCQVSSEPGGGVIAVGRPAEVEIVLRSECVAAVPRADEVVVEVLGPDERPVAATASAPVGVGRTATRVTFTPDRPGAWTVRARFEPGVGNAQRTFQAAVVRADAGFRLTAIDGYPKDCGQFGVLASGIPVCLIGPYLATAAVGGALVSGDAFALDGDALWALQRVNADFEYALFRFVPDAGLTHRSDPFRGPVPPPIAARNGSAYVVQSVQGQSIAQFTPDADGGLSVRWRPLADRQVLGLTAGEDHLLVAARRSSGETLVLRSDGGASVFGAGSTVALRGADDDVLWADGMRFTGGRFPIHELTVVALDGNTPRLGAIGLGAEAAPSSRLSPQMPVVPFLADAGPALHGVLSVDGSDLIWEAYEPGPGFGPVVGATLRHVFVRSTDGNTLKIIDR